MLTFSMEVKNGKYFNNRKEIASDYFRSVWFECASKVVDTAIRVYHLDEKQANALKKAYLKPNHYYTVIN